MVHPMRKALLPLLLLLLLAGCRQLDMTGPTCSESPIVVDTAITPAGDTVATYTVAFCLGYFGLKEGPSR